MYKIEKAREILDIKQELSDENYEKVKEYADRMQGELIHNWQFKNREKVSNLVLLGRTILNYWLDSIAGNMLWTTLVRCGAWIGTLETLEKSMYEEDMDRWLQKRGVKKISSIKHLPEILYLLEVKGIMTHGEMVEKLGLNYSSTLTEIMKKIEDLELVMIKRSGKYKLYSLTDAGVRYAKQIRAGENEETLLADVIRKYDLKTNEEKLDLFLRSLNNEENGVTIKPGQNIGIITDANRKMQNMKVEKVMKEVSFEKEEKPVLILKNKIEPVSYISREA